MSNVTLYGLVTHLSRTPDLDNILKHNLGTYNCSYVMRIGDNTGVLDINLYFNDQWYDRVLLCLGLPCFRFAVDAIVSGTRLLLRS